jgi:hypothetical protein
MTPSRILPDLQCSLLCEDVRQEINGNFVLLGVLNQVRVPQVPLTVGRLFVFNRWTAGYGQFIECIRVIAPDQTTVLRKSEMKFDLSDVTGHSINVTVLGGLKLETGGSYFVEILVDDVMKIRYPLTIHVVPPKGQPQGGPGAAQP